MKIMSLISTLMLTLALSVPADAGFGGSRGGFSGGSRSSSFGGSRSSSFGGSRSSSFGGSRSAPSAPSRSYSAPSKSSSFGGNRSSSSPAPIVRNRPSNNSTGTSGGTVTHNYYGGGGGYYGGNGFYHGMMLGYLWNRPQTVVIGGQQVVVDAQGQPVYENGVPVVYRESSPFLSFLGTLVMLALLGGLLYFLYVMFIKREA